MAAVLDIQSQHDFDELFAGIVDDFRAIDWQPWLTESMRQIEAEHAQMFAEQRGPAGEPWKPLAPSTVKRKGHSTILVETGRLRQSLTEPGAGIREMFQEQSAIGLIFGTDVPYSIYHILGTSRLPIRDHVGLPLSAFERMVGSACDYALSEVVKQ